MPPSARSLAEDLRSRSDGQLEILFAGRPDLLRPVPKSFSDLALRANGAPSTITALDDLTAAQLEVLESACALAPAGRFGTADLVEGLDSDPQTLSPLLSDLYDRVLLWGDLVSDIRVPSAVREVMGPEPCGLEAVVRANQTGVRLAVADPAAFDDRLKLAPADARAVLTACAWGPATIPVGPGFEWLAQQDFMAVDESGRVTVPREIALLIRRGQLLPEPRLHTPELPTSGAGPARAVDEQCGHAADQFVRDVDRVLTHLARGSLGRQSTGAFSSRDFDRLTAAVGLAPAQAALILALAWTVEWIDWDDENRLRPTTVYEASLPTTVAQRWGQLAAAWVRMPRITPPDPGRVLAASQDAAITRARHLVLAGLAAGAGADVSGWLRWHRPRLSLSEAMIATTRSDAEALGFSFGGIPSAAALLAPRAQQDPASLASAMAPYVPELTDRVVLQADLTATALGPLDSATERRLTSVADWESGGAATVFRFSPESIRAALARGESGGELLTWLTSVSATPVPQALSVLIADQSAALPDVAVYAAESVVTCDPTLAPDLLADPALAPLALREVAPGVLLTTADPDEVARALVDSGRAASRPDTVSGPVDPHRPPATHRSGRPAPHRVIASLRSVERGDLHSPGPPNELRPAGPSEILATLHAAVGDHRRIWLTFAEGRGDRLTHLIEPLQIDGGDVCAFDHTVAEIRTIPLERIVASATA